MHYDEARKRAFLVIVHGSQAYGTSTPESDTDIRGICFGDPVHYLGCTQKFEQALTPKGHEEDGTIFEFRKFLQLASVCNPNVVEILFVEEENIIQLTKVGEALLECRDKFLTRKARYTFSGYARSQLKRIQRHRHWLMDPPTHQPTRVEFGLPERTIIPLDQLMAAQDIVQKKMFEWDMDLERFDRAERIAFQEGLSELYAALGIDEEDRFKAAGRIVGLDENFLQLLGQERNYRTARDNWRKFTKWKNERNPVRFELEKKYGYDTKHAMHLVRLLRMGAEILSGKGMLVRRPDAEELLAIRNHGIWTYEALIEYSEQENLKLAELEKNSKLPKHIDTKWLDQFTMTMIGQNVLAWRQE